MVPQNLSVTRHVLKPRAWLQPQSHTARARSSTTTPQAPALFEPTHKKSPPPASSTSQKARTLPCHTAPHGTVGPNPPVPTPPYNPIFALRLLNCCCHTHFVVFLTPWYNHSLRASSQFHVVVPLALPINPETSAPNPHRIALWIFFKNRPHAPPQAPLFFPFYNLPGFPPLTAEFHRSYFRTSSPSPTDRHRINHP